HDAPDVPRIGEARVLPGLAAIERAIDTVAPRRTLAIVRFAGADPDDVRIVCRNRDVANRSRSLLVEQCFERRSIVRRFPKAARGRADVENIRVAFDYCDVVYAAAHIRGSN